MEAARTSETSVDNLLHGSTSQKTVLNFILAAARTWNSHSLVEFYRRFRDAYCLHYQGVLMMEAVSISETSVNFYKTTLRNIPEAEYDIVVVESRNLDSIKFDLSVVCSRLFGTGTKVKFWHLWLKFVERFRIQRDGIWRRTWFPLYAYMSFTFILNAQ
jgi:hypothetical protein